jgi:hypothetical protein
MNNKNGARFTILAEGAAQLLDTAVRFGLISGSAIAVALGQFLLGGMLAVLAVGMFLRFKRGRVSNRR